MKNLIIVESPTKARTLSRFLGNDYVIEATMGHIRDLPKDKLGIDIANSFKPDYRIIPGRSKKIQDLKRAANSAESVLLATDPDREGEAIAFHVYHMIKPTAKSNQSNDAFESKVKRIVFHEITKSAIDAALEHPRKIDMQLVDAQQARRLLDRLVGYKLSPVLWNKLGKRWLSAGRVQSVVLRLIVEREREIEAFRPVEYWVIEAEFETGRGEGESVKKTFTAKLNQIDDKKAEIAAKEIADTILADLQKSAYTISRVETKEVRRYPYPPFTTSTLQQAGSNRYGWSAKRTMQTAQKLYEEGFITYHRTDSTNISNEAVAMVRTFIGQKYGQAYLPPQPKFYKTKSKVAQEAHEAIRPTKLNEAQELERIGAILGREAIRLYELIYKRFVACQMNEAIFDQTSVDVKGAGSHTYIFRASGQVKKFEGWLVMYVDPRTHMARAKTEQEESVKEEENPEAVKELPALSEKDLIELCKLLPQQKFTEPPPRFNEASLIKLLEEKGIGRPSTYAPIISTIQDRKYVEKRERRFYPSDLGLVVNDFLVEHFPDIFDISFTAKMEDDLDAIANGAMKLVPVIHEFYDPLSIKIEKVYKDVDRVKVTFGTTDEICDTCGSPMVVRMSRFGKFLACSKFPECKFTKNILEKAGIACPLCGGDIVLRRTRRGKQFYGCINYPKCSFAAWKKEDILKNQPPASEKPTIESAIKPI